MHIYGEEKPFSNWTVTPAEFSHILYNTVVIKDERCDIPALVPKSIVSIVNKGWVKDPSQRLSMAEIYVLLEGLVKGDQSQSGA